jgi:hypothetical protein
LVLAVAAGPWHSAPALAEGPGQTQAEYDTRVRESKARARELLSQGARRRIEAARRWREAVREARRRGLPAPTPGARQRPAPFNEDRAAARTGTVVTPQAPRLGASGAATIPANVRANNTAGDAANTTQAEQAIAVWGNYVLVAWNDGIGPQYQGYGYSTDGGQTFTDGGAPQGLAGWTWASDPIVTVNEKTGRFYYCGLVDVAPASNGIGVVPGTFSGNTFSWGTPVLVRSVSTATAVLDKEWLVADSTTGNLYLTYSTFDASDHIDFQRSTNPSATGWSSPVQISAPGDDGAVQGSRPVVGLGSDIYAAWSAIGSAAQDFIRIRRSQNRGASWDTPVTAVSAYLNFGTGAPGFNRERGVDFPSIAVDRTAGVDRGHVYLAWTESVNKYDDPLNTLGNLVETEKNDFFSRADPFTPGQRLRGSLSSIGDFDYFSFSAIQGTNYLFECDSVPGPLYTFRVFCGQDTNVFSGAGARLAFSGDLAAPAGGRGYIIWTAPTTDTYYLRMACVTSTGADGYRISTGIAGVGVERGRDSRDVFVSASGDRGDNWTTPIRVNDANPYYDEWLPEVTVGADGMPYVSWFDWRDDGCGGESYQFIARSANGGATWANQRFSDVQNDWTNISVNSNLAPDQGDYSHMYADPRYVRVAWADGRGGSPDVFTTRIDTWPQLSPCQADLADSAGHTINPSWTVTNLSPLFTNLFNYRLTSQRNWPLPAPGVLPLAAEASGPINLSVAVPDTAAPGVNRLCLVVTSSQGAAPQSCCFNLTVQAIGGPPPPPPGPEFALDPSVPNPATDGASITFSLPQAGPVKLRIFGPLGELVRTLLDGNGALGPNTVTWDGRDDHGHLVGAGTYFYKLEGFGQSRTRRLVWLK